MTLSGAPGSKPLYCAKLDCGSWLLVGALLNFVSSGVWISVSGTLLCLPEYWGNLCVSGRIRTPLGREWLNLNLFVCTAGA